MILPRSGVLRSTRCLTVLVLAVTTGLCGASTVVHGQPTLASRGKALFVEKGCYGCHTIGQAGTPIAPDLSHAAAKFGESALIRWLGPSVPEISQGARVPEVDPARSSLSGRPSHMPQILLSDAEARALAAYLASLP